MLIAKDNPQGIDTVIAAIQGKLYGKLLAKWGNVSYIAYGRCYRNKKDISYIAEVYEGNNEYKECYWDDSVDAVSFFGVDPTTRIDVESGAGEVKIHVVFFVNLARLKPGLTTRVDEEVRLDVQEILRRPIRGFRISSISTGIENVLREYSGSYRSDRLKTVDMHPTHCFRFDLQGRYNPFTEGCK